MDRFEDEEYLVFLVVLTGLNNVNFFLDIFILCLVDVCGLGGLSGVSSEPLFILLISNLFMVKAGVNGVLANVA